MAVVTGALQRKDPGFFDSALELRDAAAAAITSVGADFAAPDYESAEVVIGAGQYFGRMLIRNLAITLNAANDSWAHIAVVGVNGSVERELGAIRIGDALESLADADVADADVDIEVLFTNSMYDVVFPNIKVVAVTAGTTISLDFTAHVGRLLVPS